MRHEKIIVRPDGMKVKIVASVVLSTYGIDDARWEVFILMCKPKKRTWYSPIDTSSHAHRMLKFPEGREADVKRQQLLHVTEDEILAAKLELWKKLKPTK